MMFIIGGAVLIIVLFIGILQTFGETRIAWIFPIITFAAVLVFLARCMFAGPAHP
jgi:hypothetical protein